MVGVFHNIDAAQYQSIERLSSSGIKQMLRSPAHYRQWKDTPPVPTPAMQFGTAVHVMVLEPGQVSSKVVAMPDDAPDKRSVRGREWHIEFLSANAGKIILCNDDFERAKRTALAVLESPGWHDIVDYAPSGRGFIETSILWVDRNSEVPCKARPDWFSADNLVCVDIKTCVDASREVFMRQLWNLRYDIQAELYLQGLHAARGVMPHSFAWVTVETDHPHGVAWYRIPASELEIARADIANAMHAYAECVRTQRWPCYPHDVQDIRLPPWARSTQRSNSTTISLASQEY